MERFSIDRLEISEDNLIVNDTLLYLNFADSLDSRWTAHQMEIEEWVVHRGINKEALNDLKNLMKSSKNLRIVREKGVYFFNEGSWVDSDWGKAYSVRNISSKEAEFSFDQVQELNTIDNRPNWYEYYAD